MFRARWWTASVYIVAGAAFGLVMSVGWLAAAGELLSIRRVATLFWIQFWPTILAINLVTAIHNQARVAIVAAYFLVLALWPMALGESSDLSVGGLFGLWLILAGPATFMLAAFSGTCASEMCSLSDQRRVPHAHRRDAITTSGFSRETNEECR